MSWGAADVGLPSHTYLRSLAIDPRTPNTLYVVADTCDDFGCSGTRLFKSTNAGSSWHSGDAGLPNTFMFALAIDPTAPSTLYLGTTAGDGGISNTGGV